MAAAASAAASSTSTSTSTSSSLVQCADWATFEQQLEKRITHAVCALGTWDFDIAGVGRLIVLSSIEDICLDLSLIEDPAVREQLPFCMSRVLTMGTLRRLHVLENTSDMAHFFDYARQVQENRAQVEHWSATMPSSKKSKHHTAQRA
jgi:hypothetical protein